jgi:hypothetical protein
VGRFAIGYLPMYGLLIGDVLDRAPRHFAPRHATVISATAGTLLAAALIRFTWPAAQTVRQTISPPVAAIRWIRANTDPQSTHLFVDASLTPQADYLLSDYSRETTPGEGVITARSGVVILSERPLTSDRQQHFSRRRKNLWDIVRRYYFDVFVAELQSVAQFGEGWYDPETDGRRAWQWMGKRGVVYLPVSSGGGTLRYRLSVPFKMLRTSPQITVSVNGHQVDQFTATQEEMTRSIFTTAGPRAPMEIVFTTSETARPVELHINDDGRDLGICLWSVDWTPQPAAKSAVAAR